MSVNGNHNGAAVLEHSPSTEAPAQSLLEKLGITIGEEMEIGMSISFTTVEKELVRTLFRDPNPVHKAYGLTQGVVHGDLISAKLGACLVQWLERRGLLNNFLTAETTNRFKQMIFWSQSTYSVTARFTSFNPKLNLATVRLSLWDKDKKLVCYQERRAKVITT